tara:strand:- start:100 stop:582 length:483 start_codon:yes stop_codon:yes gene_type:complete
MEIEGFENYTIDETGNIWNKKRNIFMKPYINNKGYLRVGLHKNGKEKKFLVHRLVALAFIPNPNNYPEVDHFDINPSNNNLSNLRWATSSMQNENRRGYGKIKHKYIGYVCDKKYKYYEIKKNGYFQYRLNVEKYTLDDAIDLRRSLLSFHDLDYLEKYE